MMIDGMTLPQTLDTASEDTRFHEVYRRNISRVYRLCYIRLGHREDAEDASQNVFLRWMKHPCIFASEEHEKAYFLRAAANECTNVRKSFWRQNRCDTDSVPDALLSVSEEEAFEDSAVLDGARSLLDQLPMRYREVLYLYYCEELPTKTIARLLSRRESTVRTQLQTGRGLLRQSLERGESK